jgi:hypothetical protein
MYSIPQDDAIEEKTPLCKVLPAHASFSPSFEGCATDRLENDQGTPSVSVGIIVSLPDLDLV